MWKFPFRTFTQLLHPKSPELLDCGAIWRQILASDVIECTFWAECWEFYCSMCAHMCVTVDYKVVPTKWHNNWYLITWFWFMVFIQIGLKSTSGFFHIKGIQFLSLLTLHWRVPGVLELIPAVLVWRRRLHPRKSHLHLKKNNHHPPPTHNLEFPISLMCMGPCLWTVRRSRRTWSGPTRAQVVTCAQGINLPINLLTTSPPPTVPPWLHRLLCFLARGHGYFRWWQKYESLGLCLSLFQLEVCVSPVPLTRLHSKMLPKTTPPIDFGTPPVPMSDRNPYAPVPHLSLAKESAGLINHKDWWHSVFAVIERSHKYLLSAGPSDSRSAPQCLIPLSADAGGTVTAADPHCCVAAMKCGRTRSIFLRFWKKKFWITA